MTNNVLKVLYELAKAIKAPGSIMQAPKVPTLKAPGKSPKKVNVVTHGAKKPKQPGSKAKAGSIKGEHNEITGPLGKFEESMEVLRKHVYSTDNQTLVSTQDATLPYQVVPKLLLKMVMQACKKDHAAFQIPGTEYVLKVNKDFSQPHLYSGTLMKDDAKPEIVSHYERTSIPQICLDILIKAGLEPEQLTEHKPNEAFSDLERAIKDISDKLFQKGTTVNIANKQIKPTADDELANDEYEFVHLPSPEIHYTGAGISVHFGPEWSKYERIKFLSKLLHNLGK